MCFKNTLRVVQQLKECRYRSSATIERGRIIPTAYGRFART